MTAAAPVRRAARTEPAWVRAGLIAVTLGFIGLVLLLPLAAVFIEAFRKGAAVYFANLAEPATLDALRLTGVVASIVVPLNTVFGLAAAWAITRFEFAGKSLLLTLIDLPFAVSPVIAGLIFVSLLGFRTPVGGWLAAHGVHVIFALPGMVLATVFVTFPYVARELIPLMREQGSDDEEAAVILGAGAWRTFRQVTLPRIRWGLVYGVILANARAIGEFGAVSVVSGHIRGATNTLPLHVEILFNEYNFAGAFAAASLLTLVALATIAAKHLLEWKLKRSRHP